MNNKVKNIGILLMASMLMLNTSCIKNEICISANNLLSTELYTVNDHSEIVAYKIDSISLFTIAYQDTMYYNAKKLDKFSIPLADTATQLTLILKLNGDQDTIWLNYRPYSVFRSTTCGVINRYEIQNLSFTNNSIWEIYIKNNIIDENKEINFLMFYRTH